MPPPSKAFVKSRTQKTKTKTKTKPKATSPVTTYLRTGRATDSPRDVRRPPKPPEPRPRADTRLSLPRSQRQGLAQTESRRSTSKQREPRTTVRPLAALDALVSSRAARGRLLSPEEFEKWRIEQGRFSRDSGKTNVAPTYGDYLRFVERRRGLRGTGAIAERAARGQFEDARTVQKRREAERSRREREVYGILPRTTEEALALNQRNAVERRESTGSILGRIADPFQWLGGKVRQHVADPIWHRLQEELGLDGDATSPVRIGNRTVSVVPRSSRSNVIARDLAAAGAESSTRRAVHTTVAAAGFPGLAVEQVAEAFLYTPAFVAELFTNPKGAFRGLYETAKYAFTHPQERPGDIIALVWGAGGGLLGAMGRLRSLARGDVRGAVAPRPSARSVPGAERIPGAVERTARRNRAVIADLRQADPLALERSSRRPVIPRITKDEARAAGVGKLSRRRERDLRLAVQDEAIRAQFDQTTPAERLAFFEQQLEEAASTFDRRNIELRIAANKIVINRKLVKGKPGNVRVVDRALGALAEHTARLSDETAAEKALLGIVREETQEARLSEPGRIIRGIDALDDPDGLVPGQTYGTYRMDIAGRPPSVPTRVLNRIGLRRTPRARRMTGETIRKGSYGNVVTMTARDALEVAKYREWLELWKEGVTKAKSATQVLNEVVSGQARLEDYIPIRIGPGDVNAATRLGIRVATDPNTRITSLFGVLDDYAVENFAALAERIDQNGVFGFVHKSIGTEPVVFTRRGFLRSVASAINQLGRFAVFTAGLTAWLVPNIIGQVGATLLHQGLATVPNIFWSVRNIRQVPRGLQRVKFYRELDAIGGHGIVRSTDPGGGPLHMFSRLNDLVGEQLARFMDVIWRRNATLYEFALRGYTNADSIQRAIAEAKRNPAGKAAADIREIAEHVDQNYGAFRHMSDFERNTITDIIFIYPWLRASAELALKFPINHPVKASALELGGSHANEKARRDFERIFVQQGMTREEAKQAAEYIMSKVPGIFAMGNSAITPLSIALLSTPGEIIHALDPLKRGDWRTLALNVIDFGSPAVGLFMAAMRSLYNRHSEGLGPEVERELGGFSRDYSLIKRLAEGGTQWFKYSPIQAIGARIFGSFFPRTPSGEGILESLELDEARRAAEIRSSLSPAERAYQDVFKVREQYRQLAVQHGLGDRLNEEIKTVFNRHAERLAERNTILERLGEDAYKTGTRSLSLDALRELTSADVRLLAKWGIISDEDAAAALNWIRGASEAELRDARMRAGNNEFREAYKAYYDARALLREEYGMSDYELPDLP